MENFGDANYGVSKHGKKLVVYTSRILESRVYEFCYSSKKQLKNNTTNYYYQCASCLKLKQAQVVHGAMVIPKITVINDIIMTNPDAPTNGAHFCDGISVGKSLALQLDREARNEAKRGIKRPHQAHENAESSIQRRFSG